MLVARKTQIINQLLVNNNCYLVWLGCKRVSGYFLILCDSCLHVSLLFYLTMICSLANFIRYNCSFLFSIWLLNKCIEHLYFLLSFVWDCQFPFMKAYYWVKIPCFAIRVHHDIPLWDFIMIMISFQWSFFPLKWHGTYAFIKPTSSCNDSTVNYQLWQQNVRGEGVILWLHIFFGKI